MSLSIYKYHSSSYTTRAGSPGSLRAPGLLKTPWKPIFLKNSNFTFKAIIVSAIYWLIDSVIHRFIYSEEEFEFIPSEENEFWMRVIIVVLLICFGLYADHKTKEMVRKEMEKRIIFNATVSSAQHILNNLLNQMQLFKLKAEESNSFDKKTMGLYEQSFNEGKELVKKLSSVKKLTERNIKESVYLKSEKI